MRQTAKFVENLETVNFSSMVLPFSERAAPLAPGEERFFSLAPSLTQMDFFFLLFQMVFVEASEGEKSLGAVGIK